MRPQDVVTQLTLAIERRGIKDGIREVARQIGMLPEDELRAIWDDIGIRALRHLYRARRSRIALSRTLRVILDTAVSVGTTGVSRAIGKLTSHDLLVIANFRERMGMTLTRQAVLLKRLAKQVGDRTVGEAWGDLAPRDRDQFLRIFDLSLQMNAA